MQRKNTKLSADILDTFVNPDVRKTPGLLAVLDLFFRVINIDAITQ